MDSKNKAFTIIISFSCVIAMTLVTHYVVTIIPSNISKNINTDLAATVADINAFEPFSGVTPLMRAAIDSDIERTKFLLENGANPNIRSANADRDYALNYALINGGKIGSLAVAQLLIAHGADVNAGNVRGLAPIHALMQITQADNRAQMLKLLMDNGAHINAQAEDGSTMLHITATMNDRDWVRYVNQNYGQLLNYNIADKKGRTPLDLAIQLGRVSVNNTDSVENEMRKRPIYIGDNYDTRAVDAQRRSGLQLAVLREDMKFVEELIKHGANLAHQDMQGNTALHYAITTQDPQRFVNYLLQAKAPTNIANNAGQTPLFWVMKIRSQPVRLALAKSLVNAGSPIANKDRLGRTMLDLAKADDDQQLVDLFASTLRSR